MACLKRTCVSALHFHEPWPWAQLSWLYWSGSQLGLELEGTKATLLQELGGPKEGCASRVMQVASRINFLDALEMKSQASEAGSL